LFRERGMEMNQKLKEFGYEVTIKKDNDLTHLCFQAKEGEENLYLKELEQRFFLYKDELINKPIKKEAMSYVLNELESKAKRCNKMLFIDICLEKQYKEVLEQNKFYKIMQDEQLKNCEEQLWKINHLYKHHHLYTSLATIMVLQKHVKIYDEFEKMLKERTQKELLFYYINSSNSTFDRELCIDGFFTYIEFIARRDVFVVCIYDGMDKKIHEISSTKEKEVLDLFNEWTIKIEKQQRIKNVFEPSMFFFDKLMYSNNDFYSKLNTTMTQRFRELLSTIYTRKEIEEWSARYIKGECPKFHFLNANNYFFYFGENGFISDKGNKDFYIVEKSINIQENIKKILHQQWEKEVDENLKSIL